MIPKGHTMQNKDAINQTNNYYITLWQNTCLTQGHWGISKVLEFFTNLLH